jgi:hypothetical protein
MMANHRRFNAPIEGDGKRLTGFFVFIGGLSIVIAVCTFMAFPTAGPKLLVFEMCMLIVGLFIGFLYAGISSQQRRFGKYLRAIEAFVVGGLALQLIDPSSQLRQFFRILVLSLAGPASQLNRGNVSVDDIGGGLLIVLSTAWLIIGFFIEYYTKSLLFNRIEQRRENEIRLDMQELVQEINASELPRSLYNEITGKVHVSDNLMGLANTFDQMIPQNWIDNPSELTDAELEAAARTKLIMDEIPQAHKFYEAVAKLRPGDDEPEFRLAALEMRNGDDAAAANRLKGLIKRHGGNPPSYLYRYLIQALDKSKSRLQERISAREEYLKLTKDPEEEKRLLRLYAECDEVDANGLRRNVQAIAKDGSPDDHAYALKLLKNPSLSKHRAVFEDLVASMLKTQTDDGDEKLSRTPDKDELGPPN